MRNGDNVSDVVTISKEVAKLTKNFSSLTTTDVSLTSIVLQLLAKATVNQTLDGNVTAIVSFYSIKYVVNHSPF